MKKTILDLFHQSVERFPGNTLLLDKANGHFHPTTYAEAKVIAARIGAGLVSMGIEKGERISILAEGSGKWILSELGMFYAGAVSVPLSIKLEESNDLYFRLHHGDVKLIFVSAGQLPKLRKVRERLPLLSTVIVINGETALLPGEVSLDEVIRRGEKYLETHRESFEKIGQSLQNDDYATITYTSGTTADPKGVVLTHRNYTANVEQAFSRITIPSSWRTLLILPLDHCFAHVVGFYTMIACGASVATVQVGKTPIETLKNIPLNIKEVKPHFLLSVPALAKSFRKNIESGVAAKGALAAALFKQGLAVAYAYNKDGYSKGTGVARLLKPLVAMYDKLVFNKVRENFGGELQFFIGGGALLDAELQRFFYAIGIPMFQGYGLSEATPIISTNAPSKHRFGSSGVPVEPMEITIRDEKGAILPNGIKGEIVIRGENVMAGYWKNPAASAETVRDGWLFTGDLGYLTDDGFLYVLGRFKSLLIASDGEKYSPEGLEEGIVELSPYIEQMILHNNQSPYTVALVVPNKEAVKKHFDHHHSAEHGERTRASVKLIADEIARFRSGGEHAGLFPERWLPAAIAILDEPFTEQNGLVNSTMKVIRGKVEETYAARIEYMFTPEGKDPYNPSNMRTFSEQ